MWVCLLILLLPTCSSEKSNFLGTVMTFYPNRTSNDTLVLRNKLSFNNCDKTDDRCLFDNCSLTEVSVDKVDEEIGEWCQNELVLLVNTSQSFEHRQTGSQWINVTNGVTDVRAVTRVDPRMRSDTGRANASPVTTILPLLRVPSNCPRNLKLLTFDPDGDRVRCRYENITSVLTLSSSCIMTFSPSNGSQAQGMYAIQLLMEDFPRQHIIVTDGTVFETLMSRDPISQIPIQFVLSVDPPVPSCNDGVFLPTFLLPTPANGHYLYTTVNRTLNIMIAANSSKANVSELLFSGPSGMTKTTIGNSRFVLSWTPSASGVGRSHPVCFVVQANGNQNVKLHSELRCVFVVVQQVVAVLKAGLLSRSSLPPENLQELLVLQVHHLRMASTHQLKNELMGQRLPFDITLRVVNFKQKTTSTKPNPSAP